MNNIYGEKTETKHTQTKAKATIISSNTFFLYYSMICLKNKRR